MGSAPDGRARHRRTSAARTSDTTAVAPYSGVSASAGAYPVTSRVRNVVPKGTSQRVRALRTVPTRSAVSPVMRIAVQASAAQLQRS
jgi:hypothetical protein